jgi:hypothetical protein
MQSHVNTPLRQAFSAFSGVFIFSGPEFAQAVRGSGPVIRKGTAEGEIAPLVRSAI